MFNLIDNTDFSKYPELNPGLNIEYLQSKENVLGHVAWEGFKRFGEKGLVILNYTKEYTFEVYYQPREKVIEVFAIDLPFMREYRRAKAKRDGIEFNEEAMTQGFLQPLLMMDNYNPSTEMVLCINDQFHLEISQEFLDEWKGTHLLTYGFFTPTKPVEECHLEHIKQKYKPPEKKKKQQPEATLEHDLYCWLMAKGIDVERQVSTASRHRLDLWIPGKMMLELKASKITGDDVCQAIDYQATYEKQILLIGKGMSDAASRGIEGYNKATGTESIVFVSWEAARVYLGAVLRV